MNGFCTWVGDDFAEANFGSFQKDGRIADIRDAVRRDMVKVVSAVPDDKFGSDDISGRVYLATSTKYKDQKEMSGSVSWRLTFATSNSDSLCLRAYHASDDRKRHWFGFEINSRVSKGEFLRRIEEMNPLLSHEVKHFLDKIDGVYEKDGGYTDADSDYQKYVRQDKEIAAYLVSMIEELDRIRKSDPDVSFEDALSRSVVWRAIYDRGLKGSRKLNKFKGKLAYFWNKRALDQPVATDEVVFRNRFVRLLYAYHQGKTPLAKIKRIARQFRTIEDMERGIQMMKDTPFESLGDAAK